MVLPAYLRILEKLRARIAAGDWAIGAQIPTDEALVQQFGVSRFTVRAALDVLVADGIIKRYRRRGTFVIARSEGAGTWMVTSLDDLVFSGFPTPPIMLDATTISCPSAVASALGLDERDRALRIRVLREANGEPYAYSVIHIPEALARKLPAGWQNHLASEPFVGLVAEANAQPVHKAIQVAHAIAAPEETARILHAEAHAPLLVLERTFLAREGTALEHAQIFCRPDRYRQIIAFRTNDMHAPETANPTPDRRKVEA
ncbi:MAG: GntR family transcriptional regulator [Acetobacteraceae bacterium]